MCWTPSRRRRARCLRALVGCRRHLLVNSVILSACFLVLLLSRFSSIASHFPYLSSPPHEVLPAHPPTSPFCLEPLHAGRFTVHTFPSLLVYLPPSPVSHSAHSPSPRLSRSGSQTMTTLGAEVTEVSLSSLPQQCAAYYVTALSEASANLARFDGIRYG